MLHLIAGKQLQDKVMVDSAGTASYHVGEAPDARTIKNAKNNVVDLSGLRARQFSQKDFEVFDHIYVMDENNYKDVLKLTKDKKQQAKVDYLLNVIYPGKNLPVPDPYYGTEADFEEVFQLVYKACVLLNL